MKWLRLWRQRRRCDAHQCKMWLLGIGGGAVVFKSDNAECRTMLWFYCCRECGKFRISGFPWGTKVTGILPAVMRNRRDSQVIRFLQSVVPPAHRENRGPRPSPEPCDCECGRSGCACNE